MLVSGIFGLTLFVAMKEHHHFKLYKPYGYLSQFVNNKTRKKKLLGTLFDFPEGTMSVGRLDVKSEGLLLLTTDGKLSDAICSQKVEKEYYVQVDGVIPSAALERLKNGVEIGLEGKRYLTKACQVQFLKEIPDSRHTAWTYKLGFDCSHRREISTGSKNDSSGRISHLEIDSSPYWKYLSGFIDIGTGSIF